MKKIIITSLFVLFLGAASLHAAPVLKVVSASPKGQQDSVGRQAINIHFNQPVVPLGEETQFSSADCPFTLTPQVEGTCRYAGTQTLVFEPDENWPDATQFTVRVPKGFSSKVSRQKLTQNYSFSFTTKVPQVVSVLPYKNEHWIDLTPTLYVRTSMPIHLARAGEFISLNYKSGKRTLTVPTTVRAATAEELAKNFDYLSAEEKATVFVVQPTEKLQPDHAYTLTLQAGLPAQTGNAGMAQTYTSVFYTYPPLTVQKVESTGCLPFTPELHLSTPVRKSEVWNHIQTVPAQAKESLVELEKDSVGYERVNDKTAQASFIMPLSFIKLTPQEKVEVTLTKGMKDIYGNTLAEDKTFTVSNTGYCPAVDFSSDGMGVLESYLPIRLPVSLMNIRSIWLEAARFNKDNFIPFQEKETSYCAKKPLLNAVFEGEYAFEDIKDKTYKTYIDLARFEPTATDSIIFSQLKIKRGQEDCWVSSTDNITDVGISFKTSADTILLWTTSLETAQPLAGLSVELRNKNNEVVWRGITDQDGLLWAPGWNKLNVPVERWGQPALYAFVTSPKGDGVISNLWNDGVEPWRFNVRYSYDPVRDENNTYLFTERGIYRPGETVYLKGIMRQVQDGNLRLPQVMHGKLVVNDARGEEIWKKDVTLSHQWGTFDASFVLPETAAPGYWDVSFEPQANGKELQKAYASFQVDPVKPADFKINLHAGMPAYVSGEEATFSAAAQYYFGAPLAGAKAQWTLRRESAWFTPKGYEKYTFTPYFLQRQFQEENGKLLLNASGTLDSRGGLLFAAKMPVVEMPVRVYTEVDVQSPSRQHLFKRESVLVHPADMYIGAKAADENYQAGKPVVLDLVAVTPEGVRLEADATAEIYREQYYSVRKVGLSGRLEWVSEKKVTPLPSQTVHIGKKGATLSFTPQEGGSYYVKFAAQDSFGHNVWGGIDVYVQGTDSSYGQQKEDDILKVTANKNEYKVGQKARIRLESPYEKALALVSVEREGILDAWTVPVKGAHPSIDVPIKDTYLPNVYVNVLLIQGRTAKPATTTVDLGKPQGKMGYVNLNVIPDQKRITTTLKTDAKSYQPGQRVSVDISTKVHGKGVPAEVVLMAVDEGVLALTDYKTPNPFDFFYGAKPLSVFTVDNRAYVIGQRSFGEKGENRGGGGGSNSKLGGTDMRSRFEFTPYFEASVLTDHQGRGTVSFVLPDNLTTFRLMAVSLTEDEFGNAENTITVAKPVMITPAVPRFAKINDMFSCRAIVYNYEDKKGQFEVSAEVAGGIILDGYPHKTMQVPLGQSREVAWPCKATATGEAKISFFVKGRYSDGVESKLNVSFPEQEQTLATYGSTVYSREEIVSQPSRVNLAADNRVTLSLASTALLQLKGAVTYLLNYPYNCLEQQLSKIVPAVTASSVIRDFNIADLNDTRVQTQESLRRLPQYQTSTGGYGYWADALPDPYLTAYALDIAAQAKQAGFDVPDASLTKAVDWLVGAFSKETVTAFNYSLPETEIAQAYSAYVLAKYRKNTDSLFNTLYAQRDTIPQTAVAYLMLEAQVSNREEKVKTLLANRLRNTLVFTPNAVYVEERVVSPLVHSNQVAATAHTLTAILSTGVKTESDMLMVSWLLSQLNAQGHWNDTHTNAAVLRAVQQYYQAYEQNEVPDFNATVTQNYQTRLSGSFHGRNTEEETVKLPFKQVYRDGAQTSFTFTKQGSGTLYYSLGQVYTPSVYEVPVNAGFTITRRITALDGSPISVVKAGERYKVTLYIKTAAARSFVVAEDYIPAGLEIVNTSLATESAAQAQLLDMDNVFFPQVAYHADRVYAFADILPAGEHTFSYLVTAVTPGTFIYPAAWARQMYSPAVFGRNATTLLTVNE